MRIDRLLIGKDIVSIIAGVGILGPILIVKFSSTGGVLSQQQLFQLWRL